VAFSGDSVYFADQKTIYKGDVNGTAPQSFNLALGSPHPYLLRDSLTGNMMFGRNFLLTQIYDSNGLQLFAGAPSPGCAVPFGRFVHENKFVGSCLDQSSIFSIDVDGSNGQVIHSYEGMVLTGGHSASLATDGTHMFYLSDSGGFRGVYRFHLKDKVTEQIGDGNGMYRLAFEGGILWLMSTPQNTSKSLLRLSSMKIDGSDRKEYPDVMEYAWPKPEVCGSNGVFQAGPKSVAVKEGTLYVGVGSATCSCDIVAKELPDGEAWCLQRSTTSGSLAPSALYATDKWVISGIGSSGTIRRVPR
jgi:hypothetical protein